MEANNMAELREALETTNNLFEHGVICTSYANSAEEMEQVEELYRKAKSALATPARNCDVGTAEEQIQRHSEWCERYGCRFTGPCKDCFAKWAQMPYNKKGEADGSK